MGNYIVHRSSKPRTGKVFLSDGTVHEFEQPITVAEPMLDHPQQVVVEFQSNDGSLKRATPLPTDHNLDMNKVYVKLPMKRGGFSLFDKISPTSDVGVGHNGTSVVDSNEERVKVDLFSEMSEERPEFLSRQFSAKGWKPNLDPIKEKKSEKKVAHWLF